MNDEPLKQEIKLREIKTTSEFNGYELTFADPLEIHAGDMVHLTGFGENIKCYIKRKNAK